MAASAQLPKTRTRSQSLQSKTKKLSENHTISSLESDQGYHFNHSSVDCSNDFNNTELLFSSLLKSLCQYLDYNKDTRFPLPVRRSGTTECKPKLNLYKQLNEKDINYPYASLLAQLHKTASKISKRNANDKSKSNLKSVMKSLSYPLISQKSSTQTVGCAEDALSSHSNKLQEMIAFESLHQLVKVPDKNSNYNIRKQESLGEILSTLGSPEDESNHFSAELFCSSFLVKVCAMERNKNNTTCDDTNASGESSWADSLEWSDSEDELSCNSSDNIHDCSPIQKKQKVKHQKQCFSEGSTSDLVDHKVPITCKTTSPNLLNLLLNNESDICEQKTSELTEGNAMKNTSQLPLMSTSEASLLKKFLKLPTKDFKQYSRIYCEQNLQKSKCLSLPHRNINHVTLPKDNHNKESTKPDVPDLIPCTLIGKSCETNDQHKNRSNTVPCSSDIPVSLPNNTKDTPLQPVSLSVSSMFCHLQLYAGTDVLTTADTDIKTADNSEVDGAVTSADKCLALMEDYLCSLCRLPFTSSIDLRCHQMLFHNNVEKLRN